jgi:aspartyl-tRNA(Asn)/glutamyl-tRNA(Gln) amidotransferase subunit A
VNDLLDGDAWDMIAAVRSRAVSAAELAAAALERAAADSLGAVWVVTEERARAEAAAVDAALAADRDPGPLAGAPVGWKDLIDTAGIRTTYGSAIFRDHVPDRDADVVARHAAAGAVTVAKLATHEFAWGTTTENPHFGACRNPHDPGRMAGGSSGGSGAAVAARTVALAPGTDTGGSIRCPASVCGIVGLKPTFGRVSLAGIRPLCVGLDHCGPMTRSVRDAALELEVMAGASVRDPRTPQVPVGRYVEGLGRGVAGMTVGVAERSFFEHTADDVAAPVRAAVEALREAGARIVEVDLGWPPPDEPAGGFYIAEQTVGVAGLWPERADEMGADVVESMRHAERVSGIEAAAIRLVQLDYEARTLEAVSAAGIDVVVTPTQAFTPPPLGTRRVPFAGRESVDVTVAMCGLTEVFNVLGWPAVTVPCGRDAAGLPVGAQLAGLPWREADCLAAAAAVERALGPVPVRQPATG